MSRSTLELAPEVADALARSGLRCAKSEALFHRGHKRGRRAWRLELADGQTIKARHLESAESAATIAAHRSRVESLLPPVIARHGSVVLESWIEGEPLTPDEAELRAKEAGALLGRLHSVELSPAERALELRDWGAQTRKDLRDLVGKQIIGPEEAERLRERLVSHAPEAFPPALTHRDYCAENMIVDATGTLQVIDNEWLQIDAAGFDLGRARNRWPLSRPAWQQFLVGYESTATHDPGPIVFWEIVGAVWSVALRSQEDPERLAIPLAGLRALCDDATG